MTTYTFRVQVEPDEDAWHAYCPALISYGGVTWGATREEALQNIHDVVQLVISDLLENGEQLPEGVQVSEELLVSVPL
ncbi:MAG: type II toxin-antitoxin system HicB family antitoxin [Rhodospirillales bacterium]|nr:type II toxin-antitoxin system HicB family antitoxin [Rhodospirillales bacterium]